MIKGVIFDLDGTLLDSISVWEDIDILFLKRRGITAPKDYSEALLNMHFQTAAAYTINRFLLHETVEEVIAEWMQMAKHIYHEQVPLKKGAKAWLDELKNAGILMGIATSCQRELFDPCLQRLGILNYFSTIIETGQLGLTKAQPMVYQKILDDWQIAPHECLVFDDILMAIKTAHQMGCQVISVMDESSKTDWPQMAEISYKMIKDFSGLSLHDLKTRLE